MATVDTSTWSADTDNNTAIEGIPLDRTAAVAQTWQAIRALMAALKGDTAAISTLLTVMVGATSSADGTSGLVPAPLAGDEDKVLRGDGTWGTAGEASSVAWSNVAGKPSTFPPSSHSHGNLTNDGKLSTASRAVVTDGDKLVDVSTATATEIGYLTGLSANAQNQINSRLLASEKITNSEIEAMMEA